MSDRQSSYQSGESKLTLRLRLILTAVIIVIYGAACCLQPGAWLWLTSIGVTFVSAWILRLAPKGALPPVPSGAYQNAAKQGSPRKRLLLDRRLREFALQVASLHALGASRFAIGKTAAIKVFGIAKVLDDLHPLRLADCMSNPKIERVRLGLISLKSGSLADM